MTYISREEALYLRERRRKMVSKYLLIGEISALYILPSLDAYTSATAKVTDIFGESGVERVRDFLDFTESPVYVPGTVTLTPEHSVMVWSLSPGDCERVLGDTFDSSRLAWAKHLVKPEKKAFREGLAVALTRGDISPVVEFFKRNPSLMPHYTDTMSVALDACGKEVSPLDIPGFKAAEPLRVPAMSDMLNTSRRILRDAADNETMTTAAGTLKSCVRICAREYESQMKLIIGATRLELARLEVEQRQPILDALTSRGVPKIIAKAVTTGMRKNGSTSVTDAEADSYANGWESSKTLPTPLVAQLLGVPAYVVESARLAEQLSVSVLTGLLVWC